MKFNSAERELLLEAIGMKGWVDIYILHDKFLLSPGQLSNAVRRLEALGLIISDGLLIKMTDLGRRSLVRQRRTVLWANQSRNWVVIPDELQAPTVQPRELYLPDFHLRRPVSSLKVG